MLRRRRPAGARLRRLTVPPCAHRACSCGLHAPGRPAPRAPRRSARARRPSAAAAAPERIATPRPGAPAWGGASERWAAWRWPPPQAQKRPGALTWPLAVNGAPLAQPESQRGPSPRLLQLDEQGRRRLARGRRRLPGRGSSTSACCLLLRRRQLQSAWSRLQAQGSLATQRRSHALSRARGGGGEEGGGAELARQDARRGRGACAGRRQRP